MADPVATTLPPPPPPDIMQKIKATGDAPPQYWQAIADAETKRNTFLYGENGYYQKSLTQADDALKANIAGQNWDLAFQSFGLAQGLTSQVLGAIFQFKLFNLQQEWQTKMFDLQTKAVQHKIDLENLVVEKQSELASKKLTTDLELAEVEKERQVAIARINADAKVAMAAQKPVVRPDYSYGSPIALVG